MRVSRARDLLLACSLFFMAGCAMQSHDPQSQAPDMPESSRVASALWLNGKESYRIRFSAEWSDGTRRQTFQGLARLDCGEHTARVVALSELGAKLFDATVGADAVSVHSSLPGMGVSALRESVRTGIQRMLLAYLPSGRDLLRATDPAAPSLGLGQAHPQATHTLTRCEGSLCLENVWAQEKRLAAAVHVGERLLWQARFTEYAVTEGVAVPHRLQYADFSDTRHPWYLDVVFVAVRKGNSP